MKKVITEKSGVLRVSYKGYKPIREGYQPNQGPRLDSSKPPQGGSGLPSIPPGANNQTQPPNPNTPKKDK